MNVNDGLIAHQNKKHQDEYHSTTQLAIIYSHLRTLLELLHIVRLHHLQTT